MGERQGEGTKRREEGRGKRDSAGRKSPKIHRSLTRVFKTLPILNDIDSVF